MGDTHQFTVARRSPRVDEGALPGLTFIEIETTALDWKVVAGLLEGGQPDLMAHGPFPTKIVQPLASDHRPQMIPTIWSAALGSQFPKANTNDKLPDPSP